MPEKDLKKNGERESQQTSSTSPSPGMDQVLATLNQVFSSFHNQLDGQAPKDFDGAARHAVDIFNQIAAAVKLQALPHTPALKAEPRSQTEIYLTWSDAPNNADRYELLRCQGASCTEMTRIAELPSSDRNYRDINLSPAMTYRYQLIAINARGEEYSNIADASTQTISPKK